jgi:hypothetical protein
MAGVQRAGAAARGGAAGGTGAIDLPAISEYTIS